MADIIRRLRLQTSAFRTYRAYGTEKTRAISAERLEIIAAVIGNKKEKALRLLGEHIMRGASVVP
jgi:DNA-binding GntR family transcriptional regulator